MIGTIKSLIVSLGKTVQNPFQIIQYLIYIVTVFFFYFVIIWNVGENIAEKCRGNWRCSHYLHDTGFGYKIDLADHQWREFRKSLGLLAIVALGTSCIDRVFYFFSFECESSSFSHWFDCLICSTSLSYDYHLIISRDQFWYNKSDS